tara:strand:+ start:183 stop:851 length:669 start_codon:yes stop_codon:yes gene_type:complete
MKKNLLLRIFTSLVIIPLAFFFIIYGNIFFSIFLILLFILTSYEWNKITKQNKFIKIFGIILLFFSFYSAYELRNYLGYNFFILIVSICIFTDIGGYLFGKVLKGPKLTKISPKKTYSGVIGSFVLPIIFSFVYFEFFVQKETLNYILDKFFPLLNILELKFYIMVMIISFISQSGDLVISIFKRHANVKDTGKLLPGHGGLLDRIDGLVFVIPIIYLLIKF